VESKCNPPIDHDKWADLVKNITEHWTNRYGADEVKAWFFEIWNEPNLSWLLDW
jgi:xylan 1,4-beta-xylosidase